MTDSTQRYAPAGAPARSVSRGAGPFTIASFVCAAVAVLFLPPVFGIAGVVLGFIGRQRGDRLATWAIVASIVGAAVGMLLAYVVWQGSSDDALAALLVR